MNCIMTIKTLLLKITLIATVGFIFQTPSLAGVYKWVDENGQVHYGERPGNTAAERVTIRNTQTNKPVVTEDEQTNKGSETKKDANAEASKEGAEEGTEELGKKPVKEPVKAEKPGISAKEKKRLCKEGKEDYKKISSRGRMREKSKSGEYTYLSEKQRQQRLAAAKKKQQKYCR